MVDWNAIRMEYISTATCYRALAEKYGLSIDAIKRKAAAEHWRNERTRTAQTVHKKTVQKVVQKTAALEADRIARILSVSDALLTKVEEAVNQLDTQTAKRVTRKRQILYEEREDGSFGKQIGESTCEVTDIAGVTGLPLDRLGAKLLADAIKSLHQVAAASRSDDTSLGKVQAIMDRLDQEADDGAADERRHQGNDQGELD